MGMRAWVVGVAVTVLRHLSFPFISIDLCGASIDDGFPEVVSLST